MKKEIKKEETKRPFALKFLEVVDVNAAGNSGTGNGNDDLTTQALTVNIHNGKEDLV